ncbi:MAG: LysR family transcriptional regulator [Oceanospirillaceae bacterium]|jgi:LysR family glycine cleavage system transcriptional activator|nr:LysR family transcriptional regulator [Oceanospirillaceae bacterium]MBT4442107.1 LysR family transcriptional regulator [Oceanospirillaceae bacterium]MBT6077307.1 LysR family transcriptional regulator [Oceanospirillaceae bacterium]MBT7330204.1 LysR family transcriptional regulator [Oceanospirillaceae bacterium]
MADDKFNDLPLEWVRAFEAAGRLGSFTAAAKETGLTQAAISQRIGYLERRLAYKLFVRKPRGVALTVHGEAWLPYVSSGLNSIGQSSAQLFGLRRTQLTIAASASVIQHWLMPRLASTSKPLHLTFSTMVVEADFKQQTADVEVRYGTGQWPNRTCTPLFTEQLTPLASPALLASVQHWQQLPKIAVSGPRLGWHDWAQWSGDVASPMAHYRFDSQTCALAAAQQGLGVVLASLPLAQQSLKFGALVELSPQRLASTAGPWLTAPKDQLSQLDWQQLNDLFCS